MKLLFYLLPLLFFQPAAQSQTGRISGQIRDTAGRPVPGIRVFAIPVQTGVGGGRAAVELINNITLSDKDGRYTLEDMLPGPYRIGAGQVNAPVYQPGVSRLEQGRIVTMIPGATLANLDFAYTFPSKPNELWGTVRLDDGTPLSSELRSRLQFIVSSPKLYWLADPFTLQQGAFFFSRVEPQEYTFSVAPLPFGYYVKSATYGNVDLTKSRLNLTGGLNGTDIHVVLTKTRPPGTPAGVKVSGRITGLPAGRPTVPLVALATELGRATTVSTVVGDIQLRDDGSFEIEGVPPGVYMLQSPGSRTNQTVTFDVAGTDVGNLALMFEKGNAVPLRTDLTTLLTIKIDVGEGAAPPEFEIRLTSTRSANPVPHSVKVSSKEFTSAIPEGEYRASIAGLPGGYSVVSVTAGPFDLSEPFLVTNKGIADKFTGSPILARPVGGGPATPVGITVKLQRS